MREIRLPAACLDATVVETISEWLSEPVQEGMRVLVIGGPPGAAKRQHMLAGVCGTGARPVVRAATAVPADASGNYDFLIRKGVAEIDLGQYAGAHRKSATVTVSGATAALRHQQGLLAEGLSHPPVLVLRNHQTARPDCVLTALNSAAGAIGHVIILSERPGAACWGAAAWDVRLIMLPELGGVARERAAEVEYTLRTPHDVKAETLADAAVRAVTASGARSVPGLRKLATELLRDQHDGGLLAMLIASRLEAGGHMDNRALAIGVRKLMAGLEEGYRLHLHWEWFLVYLATHMR